MLWYPDVAQGYKVSRNTGDKEVSDTASVVQVHNQRKINEDSMYIAYPKEDDVKQADCDKYDVMYRTVLYTHLPVTLGDSLLRVMLMVHSR